jgi:LacI family transcriptional regulator
LATIRDVAGAAGVSIATVSRVFNGSTKVDRRTAGRVWQVADELDYWPNSAARSLTTSRTSALGVLLPDLHGEFFSEVMRGIDGAARQEEFQILISSSHALQEEVVAAARSMRGRVDGLIIMASDAGSIEAVEEIARRFPVVLINPRRELAECGSVAIANFSGARRAVAHLTRLGHRRIAMIKGPQGNVDAEERHRGYRQALQDADLGFDPALEIAGDFSEHSGYRAAGPLLAAEPGPTAVFAANDNMAIGLLSATADAGLRIPQDLAIVGFDDITIARYLSPPLTTAHVDLHQLGRRAVEILLPAVMSAEPVGDVREVLPSVLVVRQSCGSVRQTELFMSGQGGTHWIANQGRRAE